MELEDEVNEFLLDLLVGRVARVALVIAKQAERVCRLAIHRCGRWNGCVCGEEVPDVKRGR